MSLIGGSLSLSRRGLTSVALDVAWEEERIFWRNEARRLHWNRNCALSRMEGKRRYRLLVRFVNLSLRYFSVACYRTVRILRKRRENTSEDELQRSIEELEPPRESKARQLFVSALQIVWHEFRRRRLLTEFHHPILYAVTSPLDYRVSIYSFLLHGNFRFLRFFPKRLRPLWPYSLGERIKERLDAPSITTRL